METLVNSRESWSGETIGLFQQKRCNTAPSDLSELVNSSESGGGLDHSFVGCGDTVSGEMMYVEPQFKEREVASFDDKLAVYNRKTKLEAFKVKAVNQDTGHASSKDNDSSCEGALRFYMNDENRKLCKAIHMRSTDTVASLLPKIKEKFNFVGVETKSQVQVVAVLENEERILQVSEKPLDIAVNSSKSPRFVVKVLTNTTSTKSGYHYDNSKTDPLQISTERVSRSSRSRHRERRPPNQTPQQPVTGGQKHSRQGSIGQQDVNDLSSKSNSSSDIIMERRGSRRGSRKESPSAALIQNQRRKRDESVESKLSIGKRSGSLRSRRSKSVSSIFQKTFSLRKKEHPYIPRRELSTDETAPGVLRVFGGAISPGTEYKSVLATSNSTAEELIKDALERYSIQSSYARHFVLCDVIGKFVIYDEERDSHYENVDPEGVWQEDCIRIIGDNERPLILQCFWKPGEGYSRRFELRNRGEFVSVENFEYNPYDQSTSSIVASNERRSKKRKSFISQKSKSSRSQELTSADALVTDDVVMTDEDLSVSQVDAKSQVNVEYMNEQARLPFQRQDSLGASISGGDSASISRIALSNDAPVIVNLKGVDPKNDSLVHFISKESTVIGCDIMKLGQNDICLPADDVLSHHCRLKKDKEGHCSVEPFQGALVKVNNRPILQCTDLHPGDVLCLGNHYIFMFRDATAEAKYGQATFAFVKLLQSGTFEVDDTTFYYNNQMVAAASNESQVTDSTNNDQVETLKEPEKVKDWRRTRLEQYNSDTRRLKLAYAVDKEEDIIQWVLSVMENYPGIYKLTPAYLMCMCIEYGSVKFDQVKTRELLLQVSSKIQNTVLEKTRLLAERQNDIPASGNSSLDELLPDIQPIIIWLANTLELLNFLHAHLGDFVLEPAISLPSETRRSIACAEDQVVAVLEDVVMYTFQQTVYYTTKVLYPALSAILESNPFSEDDGSTERTTMETLLSIFQTTLNFLLECSVHPQLLSQLISYLFFFTNTSLVNTLMTADAAASYYRWSSGVRLRGNMDALESWSAENHLHEEYVKYLTKLNCLVDLLATPKVQLLQSDWRSLRRDFPDLNEAQLHNVLSHYNIDARSRPVHWKPIAEEFDRVTSEGEMNENFNSHPPLMLPSKGFLLDLCRPVEDDTFYDALHELEALFAPDDFPQSARRTSSRTLRMSKTPSQPSHISKVADTVVSSRESPLSKPNEEIETIPWYKEDTSPRREKQQHASPWSSTDNSYNTNDSGFVNMKSHDTNGSGFVNMKSHDTNDSGFVNMKSHDTNGSGFVNMKSHDTSDSGFVNMKSHDTNDSGFVNMKSHGNSYTGSRESLSRSQGAGNFRPQHRTGARSSQRNMYDNQGNGWKRSNDKGGSSSNTSTPRSNTSVRSVPVPDKYMHVSYNGEQTSPTSRVSNKSLKNGTDKYDPRYRSVEVNGDPLYMNLGNVSDRSRSSHMNEFKGKPLGFSTPNISPGSINNRSPGSSPGIDRYPRSPPLIDTSTKLKPLNRVPPLDLRHVNDSSSEEFVEVNKNSALSPKATRNGLRVLPLTTDDHLKKSTKVHDNHYIRESEMDGYLLLKENLHASDLGVDLTEEDTNSVFVMELDKSERGLGLGLIDGLYTPLRQPGIYVRTLIPGAPAAMDGRIAIGDRILEVNETSIVGADYQSAMNLIKIGGRKVKFLVSKSDMTTKMQITASSC